METALADRASRSLTDFVKYVEIPGAPVPQTDDFYPQRLEPAEHHNLIIEQLEKIERGVLKRLMIFMPPGTAKSTYASVAFPTYFMGKNPRKKIICASYGADLSYKFGRRCRSVVRSDEYNQVFDTTISGENAAAGDWSLTNGSEYMAVGMLGSATGNRADGLLIDDPIKGREDADSIVIRNKTWEAYKSELRTRVKPQGFIVFILTRWHEDDPAGRILPDDYDGETGWIKAKDGEDWYVLCLHAQCERKDDPLNREIGEFLWTDWFSREYWEQEKITQGPRNWNALYQQRPAPEGGLYFERDWFKWYDEPPEHLRKYGASDYAVTANGGDYTVHGVCGVDPDDNIYILDWWRGQTSSDVWIEVLLDLMNEHKPLKWAEEKGQIIRSVGPFIDKRQRERKIYCAREGYASAADKPTRAQAIRGRAAMGKVYLPKNAPWSAELLQVLMSFPVGRVDDDIDVLSLFGRMLNEMVAGHKPAIAQHRRSKWDRAFDDDDDGNWKTV
jgi:predicted phage terminase large subunit-like protein